MECLEGRLPCSKDCSRRTDSASDSLCSYCSRQQVLSSNATANLSSLSMDAPTTASHGDASMLPVEPPEGLVIQQGFQKGLRPKCSCLNFPICLQSQKQIFSSRPLGPQTKSARSPYCASCASQDGAPSCQHPFCTRLPAPYSKSKNTHGLCSLHVADPGHASLREWPLCRNSEEPVSDESLIVLLLTLVKT